MPDPWDGLCRPLWARKWLHRRKWWFASSVTADFIYGCPVATLWGAIAHEAPFLTVIFNNSSYAIFKEAMAMMYGGTMDNALSQISGFDLGIDLKNSPDFAAIAAACHAFGLTVEDPAEIISALQQAIDRVKGGQAAVIDVKIG